MLKTVDFKRTILSLELNLNEGQTSIVCVKDIHTRQIQTRENSDTRCIDEIQYKLVHDDNDNDDDNNPFIEGCVNHLLTKMIPPKSFIQGM